VRIGIVTEYYRPWPGGISEHVHHEAEELRKRGHRVFILTGPAGKGGSGGQRSETDVMRLGFQLEFTSNGAASRMVLGRYLLGFRSILRKLQLDILHVHAPLDPFLAWSAIAASKTTTVGTFHASFEPSFLWNTLYRTLRPISKNLFDRLDARIAVSPEAARCISHYFPAEYEIIPNGVDTERFNPNVEPIESLALDPNRPTALFVGRADPRKGLPLLLEAFVEVRLRVPGARLVVVGVERAQVSEILRDLDSALVDDLVFAGYVSASDLPRYYAASQVFCSPATGRESQGIVLLEAMAAGRPPLAFDIAGYRDVVSHRRDGWLVGDVTAKALADALSELLSNSDLRAELARTGRKTALGYAWPTIAERLEAQFQAAHETRLARSETAGPKS
jgi:phosphatidylinositol alpha-mannosyltransferase